MDAKNGGNTSGRIFKEILCNQRRGDANGRNTRNRRDVNNSRNSAKAETPTAACYLKTAGAL
jgi:hypothetical protein